MLQWLPWQDAAEMAGATATTWTATRSSTRRWARAVRPWAQELTLMLVLYGLWQYAGAWSFGRANAAVARGRFIWNAERSLHLPSERTAQHLVLSHRELIHWLNVYYAFVHVPALGICLIWLFVRHRDRYPAVRTVVAGVTGASLVIQLFPVAPPRLLPHLGVTDTAAVVGPSVYSRGETGLDQLAAMPSLHVGWALIVAGAIVWVARGRWRWLALAYPVLTMLVVVVTGNHYWADGIIATVLCAVAAIVASKAYGGRATPPRILDDASARPLAERPVPTGSVRLVKDRVAGGSTRVRDSVASRRRVASRRDLVASRRDLVARPRHPAAQAISRSVPFSTS